MNNGMPGETIQNTAQDVQTEAKILAQAQEGNGSNAIAKEQGDSGGGGVSPLRNEILKAERSFDLLPKIPTEDDQESGGEKSSDGKISKAGRDGQYFDSEEVRAKIVKAGDYKSAEYWNAVRMEGVPV